LLPRAAATGLNWCVVIRPDAGDLIPGSRGLRKIRWGRCWQGQTWRCACDLLLGGVARTHIDAADVCQREQDNLTAEQLKVLRRIIEE